VHHEAWRRSELNQREYCATQGLPLKAFGNWRAKFKAEQQPPARKLLYRRGGLSQPHMRRRVSGGESIASNRLSKRAEIFNSSPLGKLAEHLNAMLKIERSGIGL